MCGKMFAETLPHGADVGVGPTMETAFDQAASAAVRLAQPPHLRDGVPDRELACAPIQSELGQRYLGAMRAAMNCALANRQTITDLAGRVFRHFFSASRC